MLETTNAAPGDMDKFDSRCVHQHCAMDDSEQRQLPAMSHVSARRCGRINVALVTVCGKLCERADGVINLCVRASESAVRGKREKERERGCLPCPARLS